MTTEPAAPRRKRGAQPGNRNAVIHGFYARRLPPDPDALAVINLPPIDELDDEIAMIRLTIRNLIAKAAEPQPLDTELILLRSLSLAVTALNRMIKTRFFLHTSRAQLYRSRRDFQDRFGPPPSSPIDPASLYD